MEQIEQQETIGSIKRCQICKRDRRVCPSLKFVAHKRAGMADGRICIRCKKGLECFPDPGAMFQAIAYMRGL